jgi:ABC-type multidrug transport system fused ATPase/permease subunit
MYVQNFCLKTVFSFLKIIKYPNYPKHPLGKNIYFNNQQRYYIAANRQLKRIESTTRSPIYSNFSETISGNSVIRAYGVQDRFLEDNISKIDHNLKFQYANLICNRWLGIRLEFFANLIVFAVAIYGKQNILFL